MTGELIRLRRFVAVASIVQASYAAFPIVEMVRGGAVENAPCLRGLLFLMIGGLGLSTRSTLTLWRIAVGINFVSALLASQPLILGIVEMLPGWPRGPWVWSYPAHFAMVVIWFVASLINAVAIRRMEWLASREKAAKPAHTHNWADELLSS